MFLFICYSPKLVKSMSCMWRPSSVEAQDGVNSVASRSKVSMMIDLQQMCEIQAPAEFISLTLRGRA